MERARRRHKGEVKLASKTIAERKEEHAPGVVVRYEPRLRRLNTQGFGKTTSGLDNVHSGSYPALFQVFLLRVPNWRPRRRMDRTQNESRCKRALA